MLFFEDVEVQETKEVKAFTESVDAREFLQEMVVSDYTGTNLELAKALQEAYDNDYLLSLNEEERINLTNEINKVEVRLEQMKEICSLNEGVGFLAWYRVYAVGLDSDLPKTVAKKLKKIKTEEDKNELIKSLQELKKTAKALGGSKDKVSREYIKTLRDKLVRTALWATGIFNFGITTAIFAMVTAVYNGHGDTDDFIKGIDVLIRDVKAVKIEKK